MHILVAEDQQVARMILATHLRSWGYEVSETKDGAQALEFLTCCDSNVDMLITDWAMPNIDGLELARRVRALSSASQYIYIILLTGKSDQQDMLMGFSEGGVDDYIVKPFEAAELKMRIQVGNRVIQSERSQRQYSQRLERTVIKQTKAIRDTQNEIINRLFNALEYPDQETDSHVRRIGVISAFLCESLGWNPLQVEDMHSAAPLHDVGKIGVPDTILHKPGPLTPEEFDIIKTHTIIGSNILSGSHNNIIRLAEGIARSHHENWDGSGYPDGLAGHNIPLSARIVAIADVYDALLTDRIYRPALPEEEVLRIMRGDVGKKFDPQLWDIFMNNLHCIRKAMSDVEQIDVGEQAVS